MDKKNKKFIKRRVQRELAFQLLYELNAKKNTLIEQVESADDLDEVQNITNFNKDEFIAEYFELRELDAKEYGYTSKVANLYIDNQDEIERLLEQNIYGWRIERVGKTEISIIRVATTEMLFIDDVPPAVAINEAVELAKVFADEKAYKFVNKVLRNIYESIKEKIISNKSEIK